MAWNEVARQLLDIPTDSAAGTDLVADTEQRLRRRLPAAVGEWFRAGANRRLAQLSDNDIAGLASLGNPDHARFLDAGLLLLETDSQHCCQWVTPLDGGDNPVVYLIDPDDFAGESRVPYADSFTAYTEAAALLALAVMPADDSEGRGRGQRGRYYNRHADISTKTAHLVRGLASSVASLELSQRGCGRDRGRLRAPARRADPMA